MISPRIEGRPGATLIEVLIAIFVMCIGLLCVLTLFVLGAQRMSAALKDDSCARVVVNARAFAQIKGLRDEDNLAGNTKYTNTGPDNFSPSDPLFVDPYGVSTGSTTLAGTNIKRISPKYADASTDPGNLRALYFSLLDGVTFQRGSGVPKLLGTNVEREINYTWAYMLQRDRLGEPASTTAQVCVFNRRPKAGTLDRSFANSTLNPSDNSILLPGMSVDTANIAPGNWALDVSTGSANKYAFANFYRISGVRDNSGSVRLDLQSPLKGYDAERQAGTTAQGTIVVMDGLVEVFDIGYGTK